MGQRGLCVILCLITLNLITINCLNVRPIIGILSQPTDGDLTPYGNQYIAASYVKYIESAGARVVPILYDSGVKNITTLLGYLNGVLFPGGGSDLTGTYLTAVQTIYNYVIQVNGKHDYFPLWGTCQGFEQLCILTSNNYSILTQFNSENYTIPLNFTKDAPRSRMFTNISIDLYNAMADQPITMNNHMYGVSPANWMQNTQLNSFYTFLSQDNDRNGKTFISTMEGNLYPVYGSQWHPEKPLFEWTPLEVTSHTKNAVLASQYVADFFVQECRNSGHSFPSQTEEMTALIYSYTKNLIYTGLFDYDFEQCYIFPPSH